LAAVAVEPDDEALAVAQAAVLDLLLDAASEEPLASLAGGDPVVVARRLVSAHLTRHKRFGGCRAVGVGSRVLLVWLGGGRGRGAHRARVAESLATVLGRVEEAEVEF